MNDPARYQGGCHCRAVRFSFCAQIDDVIECNCSICHARGFLHIIVKRDAFTLHTPWKQLTSYRFGTRQAEHLFCATCGVASFYRPRSHPRDFSVNARCVDDIDLDAIAKRPFDGRHFEAHIDALRTGKS